MSHPILYGEKTLSLVSPRIDVTTDTPTGAAFGFYYNGVEVGTGTLRTFGPVGSSPNANGASVSGAVITLQPANGSFPGLLTALAQTIAGLKTFTAGIQLGTAAAGGNRIYDTAGFVLLTTGATDDNTSVYLSRSAGISTSATNLSNMGLGTFSLRFATTANNCTGVGYNTLSSLLTGTGDVAIGSNAGQNYTGSESRNIVIAHPGVTGESNAIHIGVVGTHTSCTIAGIFGNSPGTPQMMTINSSGVMGSQAIPSGGVTTAAAIGAVPNANGMTISGSTINLQPASASFGGVVDTLTQTFAGFKTFNNGIKLGPALGFVGDSYTNAIVDSGDNILLWNGLTGDTSSIYLGGQSGRDTTTTNLKNVGLGKLSLENCTSGGGCVGLGYQTLSLVTTGRNLVGIGYKDGYGGGGSVYTTEEDCIAIGHRGVAGDSDRIRLGNISNHASCFIAGIHGVTVAASTNVVIDANGELGTIVSSKKYKHDIQAITSAQLKALMQLECVSFYMNTDPQNKYLRYGCIAEQVLPIMPEAIIFETEKITIIKENGQKVERDKLDENEKVIYTKDPRAVDYMQFIPLLLAQVQNLTRQVEELSAKVAQLSV